MSCNFPFPLAPSLAARSASWSARHARGNHRRLCPVSFLKAWDDPDRSPRPQSPTLSTERLTQRVASGLIPKDLGFNFFVGVPRRDPNADSHTARDGNPQGALGPRPE